MSVYQKFKFSNYEFDSASKILKLHYAIDDAYNFIETYKFDFDFEDYYPLALDKALQQLHLIAGVSYYKTFLPTNLEVPEYGVDAATARFVSETYQKGLGEFWYVNQLDPNTPVEFEGQISQNSEDPIALNNSGMLIAVGGGKDSLVSIELLRNQGVDISTWSLNHRSQLTPLVERIGLPHYWVEREWDSQLASLKDTPGSYNGHVPISAIIACVGAIVAILTGKQDVVMSNERSANEPTLNYNGVDINHQYSKSTAFETGLQDQLRRVFGESIRYYSLLRPLNELQIANLFARDAFDKYSDVFSSCNRAFVHGSTRLFWDGKCPKCAFVYLVLAPFIAENRLVEIFDKNVLLDPELKTTYHELLGITQNKPLECVGEINESRWAMTQMQQKYPELNSYVFDNTGLGDIGQLGNHAMPDKVYRLVDATFKSISTNT